MANVLERGMAVWRRHWPGLFLACLAVAVVPGLTAALVGALLGLLPVALAESILLAYLAVRYVEHVHRGIYGRDGRFAIDERKAG